MTAHASRRTVIAVMNPVLALHPLEAPPVEILWLRAPGADEPSPGGGKGAALRPLSAGYPVPAGFAVTGVGDDLAATVARAYAQLGEMLGTDEPVVAVRSSA